jgi:hypothetical protein
MEASTEKSMCSYTMTSKQNEIINIVKKLFENVIVDFGSDTNK